METVALDLGGLGRLGTALADATRRRILVELVRAPAHPGGLRSGSV